MNTERKDISTYQPPIRVTDKDIEKLSSLIERMNSREAAQLAEELSRAVVIPANEVPRDVVTMNSKVRFLDMRTHEELEVTLVYPDDASADTGRISILAPVGMALLGLRCGQKIHWPLPGGRARHMLVTTVLYQPEANGDWSL
jgi:regulator of nucleoside diphosphate kinase